MIIKVISQTTIDQGQEVRIILKPEANRVNEFKKTARSHFKIWKSSSEAGTGDGEKGGGKSGGRGGGIVVENAVNLMSTWW